MWSSLADAFLFDLTDPILRRWQAAIEAKAYAVKFQGLISLRISYPIIFVQVSACNNSLRQTIHLENIPNLITHSLSNKTETFSENFFQVHAQKR